MTTAADRFINRVIDHMPYRTPMRSQIAIELHGHIAERIGQGQSLDDVIRQLGDPDCLAESYLAAVPLVSAPFWRRAVAKAFDVLTLALAATPFLISAWLSNSEGLLMVAIILLLVGSTVLVSFYTAVSEALWGQTLGKGLLGIRVVRESGARISGGQSIVRQLPVFLQVYWIDVMFALFTEKSQRAFELLSKTRVVMSP
jgi:uncharacterized RDD family membrane protein YckC